MTIAGLDACGRYAIAALKRGDATLYAVSDAGVGAVRAVYSSLDRVLEKAGVKPSELEAIVVNTGPGSWTGVRVSVTYTASLAFGAGARVFGHSGFAIGKRLAGDVVFIDQLGKPIAEQGARDTPLTVELFADIKRGWIRCLRWVWKRWQLAKPAIRSTCRRHIFRSFSRARGSKHGFGSRHRNGM
jgi:hypothetical protein